MTVCPHQQKNPAVLEERRRQFFVSHFNKHEIQIRMHQLWTTQTTEKCDCYPEAHWSKSGLLTGTWASSFSQIARDHWEVNNNCRSSHKNHAGLPSLCFFFFLAPFFSLLLFKAFYSLFVLFLTVLFVLCKIVKTLFNPARRLLCSGILSNHTS